MDMQGLSAICAGLGIVEEDENSCRVGYTKGKYCLDNLKDLLRFLRRDDPESREVFKQVCQWNIASKDLIPIIEHCQDDRNLVLNAVKVLVFLTMPVEPLSSDIPQQIEYLWGLKSAITLSDTVAVIVSLLEGPLENLESEAFTEEDWKLMQLVLTLFRNLLAVQDISPYQKAAGSASQMLSLRDKFMELLFRENVMDLILVICQHVGGSHSYLRQDNLLLLEIFHYIFMGQDPELVAKAHLKSHKEHGDQMPSLSDLRSIMDEEKDKRRISRLHTSSRHSQFCGTFARFTMDGNKAIYKGNPGSGSCDSLVKSDRLSRGPTKKIVWDHGVVPLVKDNILELLHDFQNQFLSGGYNVLMQSIREDTEKEHLQVQKSDILNFFKVAKFVTSFQYHKALTSQSNTEVNSPSHRNSNSEDSTIFKGNICGPIAASMNESMFSLVISRWRETFDGLKETKDYKFLAAAGSLLKAMIRMLYLVLKLLPEDSMEPQTARVLLYKLFYDQTDQGVTQFLLNLMKSFDEHKQPRSDLADLVEMVYTIVRLMERLQDRGTLRVAKKSRKSRKRKPLSHKIEKEADAAALAEDATVQKDTAISNESPSANNDGTVSENVNGDGGIAVLPETGVPDKPDLSAAEPEKDGEDKLQTGGSEPQNDVRDESSDSSGDEQLACNEVDYNVSTLVAALANNSIINHLCWLLKFYKSNSAGTNHHIISLLRKITDDLELSPMLYQMSLLTIFHEILVEEKSRPSKECATIVNFLTDLVRRMLRKLKHQPLLFVELLFWKSRKECHHINAEQLLHEVGDLKKQNVLNGETRPAQSSGWVRRSIADALGDDEADVVIPHDFEPQINDIHNAEAPETDFILDGELDNKEDFGSGRRSAGHESQPVQKKKRRLVLNSELETKIRDLYEKFKDDQHCSQLIAEALDSDGKVSSAQVMNKLKQLGLKVGRKRRVRSLSPEGKQPLEDGNVEEMENASPNSDDLPQSSKRQPSHTRKRISALTEDQEATIRTLFEKFKDHRRCSHMISKALDGDSGTFTAAQISRKLKQLGLQVPGRKKTKQDLQMREEHRSGSDNDDQDTDNETLVSLRLRSKSTENRSLNKELENQKLGGEDDSDEELLSSVLQKSQAFPKRSRTIKQSKNEKLPDSSNGGEQLHGGSGDAMIEDVVERDGSNQPNDLGLAGTEQATGLRDAISSGGNSDVEMTDSIASDRPGSPIEQFGGTPPQKLEDELDESGDDMSPDASVQFSVNRRRMRVVFDDED